MSRASLTHFTHYLHQMIGCIRIGIRGASTKIGEFTIVVRLRAIAPPSPKAETSTTQTFLPDEADGWSDEHALAQLPLAGADSNLRCFFWDA